MACNWLIKSNVLVAFLILGSAAGNPTRTYTGTCASIGYANKCCPYGGDCQASDGNCTCDALCHPRRKCCKDVFCHREPRTCQDVGCCELASDNFSGHQCVEKSFTLYNSSRDDDRHHFEQTCPIKSCPSNCTEAKFPNGSCKWQRKPFNKTTCHVNHGDCYCDSACVCFGDCCNDVKEKDVANILESEMKKIELQCMIVYAILHIEQPILEYGEIQKFGDDEVYAQFIMAVDARLQNMKEKVMIIPRDKVF